MSVTTTVVKEIFPGAGAPAAMTPVFSVYDSSQLTIYSRVTATNVYSLMQEGVNYTVAAITSTTGPQRPTITPLAATGTANEWVVYRSSDFQQNVSFRAGGRFNHEAITEAIDRPTMLAQELDFHRKRSIHVSAKDYTDTAPETGSMELPSKPDRASKLLSFDSDGAVSVTEVSALSPGSISVAEPAATLIPLAGELGWRTALQTVRDVPTGVTQTVANFHAGTALQRSGVLANAFGDTNNTGFWYETDTKDLYYGDGSNWVLATANLVNSLNVPAPAGAGDAAKTLKVNVSGNGYEFDIPRFEATPDLTGSAGDVSKLVRVASGGSTYELSEIDQDITVGTIAAATNVAVGEGGGPVKQGNIDIGPFRIRFDHVRAASQTEVEIDVSTHFSVVWFVVGGTGIREDNDPTGGNSRAEWCYVSSTTGLKMYSQNEYMAYLAIGLKPV